jgi:predicted ester cyclase
VSTTERNKTIVRECLARGSRGEYEALGELLSPDFVLHPLEVRGHQGLVGMIETFRTAIADLRATVDHQIADGDEVASRATFRGRHVGELMGVPPTGREVEFTAIAISRCRDGRIVEEWELIDAAGLMRQIGAVPETARA